MRFEWDAVKAASNVFKHGINFDEASEVFYDPYALEGLDELHSTEELRFFIIGYSSRRLLFVTYVDGDEGVVRIISARKATNTEREIYE